MLLPFYMQHRNGYAIKFKIIPETIRFQSLYTISALKLQKLIDQFQNPHTEGVTKLVYKKFNEIQEEALLPLRYRHSVLLKFHFQTLYYHIAGASELIY